MPRRFESIRLRGNLFDKLETIPCNNDRRLKVSIRASIYVIANLKGITGNCSIMSRLVTSQALFVFIVAPSAVTFAARIHLSFHLSARGPEAKDPDDPVYRDEISERVRISTGIITGPDVLITRGGLGYRRTSRRCETTGVISDWPSPNRPSSWRRKLVPGWYSTRPSRTRLSTPRRPSRGRNLNLTD